MGSWKNVFSLAASALYFVQVVAVLYYGSTFSAMENPFLFRLFMFVGALQLFTVAFVLAVAWIKLR